MLAYLIEMRSTGGLSGSLVIVKETLRFTLYEKEDRSIQTSFRDDLCGPKSVVQCEGEGYLLGLAQGHWEIDPKDRNTQILRPGGESINLGIALVVPSFVIHETLDQTELVSMRNKAEQSELGNGVTTPD